jgi:hypothetical protein
MYFRTNITQEVRLMRKYPMKFGVLACRNT